MFKIKITYLNNMIENFSPFASVEIAQDYFNNIKYERHLKLAGFYPLSQLSEFELEQEIERYSTDEHGNLLPEPMVKIPDQYTVEFLDITDENLKAKSKLAVELGSNILAEIRHINVKKNMNVQTFLALMADQDLAFIERLVWSGSFATAKYYVQNYSGQFYTTDEKNYIITLLDSAILATA